MNNIFFTADMHFGHANIIEHSHRPYGSLNEMHSELIARWNETVAPGDAVVHIGDFCLGSYAEVQDWLNYLNGTKIMVYGNHDHWWKGAKRYAYHKKIGKVLYIYCSHFPYRTWPRYKTNGWNLCGHSHGQLEPLYNQYDVGVDVAIRDFGVPKPYSISELSDRIIPYVEEVNNG
jgi:calcineurin-like phosphoesterase family protein